MKNAVSVNLEDFPEFREVLSHKNSGDTCTFTVTAQVTEVAEKIATLKINSISASENYSPQAEAEQSSADQEPVTVVMGIKKTKK